MEILEESLIDEEVHLISPLKSKIPTASARPINAIAPINIPKTTKAAAP